jgi:hypothetical protein
VDWDKVEWTWECKGKGKAEDGERDKATTTTTGIDEKGAGGGQTEGRGVAEDERESDEEELPHAITYEAFVDFSRNDKQRATLSEELKDRGCGTLLSLLRLWWDACQLERNVTALDSGTSTPRLQPSIFVTISEDSSPWPSRPGNLFPLFYSKLHPPGDHPRTPLQPFHRQHTRHRLDCR